MSGINSEGLSALAGILLSLGFSYIPGISQRFAELAPTQKRLVMLGLLMVCALGVFGLSCLGAAWLSAPTCDQAGAWGLAKVFAAAVIANQAAFTVSPRIEKAAPAVRVPRDEKVSPDGLDLPASWRAADTQAPPELDKAKKRVHRISRPQSATPRPGKAGEQDGQSDGRPSQSVRDDKK